MVTKKITSVFLCFVMLIAFSSNTFALTSSDQSLTSEESVTVTSHVTDIANAWKSIGISPLQLQVAWNEVN